MTTKITRSNIASTGVAAGSYSAADITVNSSGQVTSASTSSIAASGGGGPKISGVVVTDNAWTTLDDTAVDVLGGYIKITGSGFNTGCLVYFNQTPASSVSFISSTELRVTTGALSAGTYVVYAINTDGGVAIRVPGVTFSASPAWQTSSTLSDQYNGVAITLGLVATEATSYTLISGSLPPGLSLNSSTGAITGTVTGVTVDTSYTFTVRATDAQNQDSPRTFTVTITVSDPYFNRTTLLLSGSALTTNTVLRDSSTNNFNLTAFGDARASNFTPYGTGWSVYFDGTGDYLSAASNSAFAFGTDNFTIEAWIYPTSTTSYRTIFTSRGTPANAVFFGLDNGTLFPVLFTSAAVITSSVAVSLNAWNHVALVRNSGTSTIYVNGVSGGSASNATDYTATNCLIGIENSQYTWFGYISNLRIVKGVAVYTGAFIPPTAPLAATQSAGTNISAITGTQTSLLTCQSNRFLDTSSNNFAITRNGDARVTGFNPFGITNTGTSGSAYFDGTDDYLSIATNTAFTNLPNDWTIECWFYSASTSAQMLAGTATFNTSGYFLELNYTAAGRVSFAAVPWSNRIESATAVFTNNTWNHIAYVRSGTTVTIYVNGTSVASGTASVIANSEPLTIGQTGNGWNARYYFNGYISDFRIVKGTAVYTANFTPPTQPLTAITNTQLLTLQYKQPHNNHSFLDSSTNNHLITRSGNATQGTFSPFSQTGWSVYFIDTSSHNISAVTGAETSPGTGDFCAELWYWTSKSGNQALIGNLESETETQWVLTLITGSVIRIQGWTNTYVSGTSGPLNSWNHVAVCRSGTTMSIFVNGSRVGTATVTNNFSGTSNIRVGGPNGVDYFLGYISNARFVKGSSVYDPTQVSITVPTGPLTAITNTKFLVCQSNRLRDISSNNFTLTTSGSPQVQAFSPFAPTAVYSPVAHGGSAYFDGSDWLQITDSANQLEFGPGVGAGYLEIWYYPTQAGTQVVVSKGGGSGDWSSTGFLYQLQFTSSAWSWHWKTAANNLTSISSGTYGNNQWFHVVVSSDGTTFALFVNGIRIGTNSTAAVLPTSRSQWRLGQDVSSNWAYGYCAGLKIVRNTVPTEYLVSASLYTVPTAPLTATTNTQLLLNFTDAAILDSTGRNVIETGGDAKSSSVVTKFTGGAMYFDGTGDSLSWPVGTTPFYQIASTNWTIEMWMYKFSTAVKNLMRCGPANAGNINRGWSIGIDPSINTIYFSSSGADNTFTGATIAINTWVHLAFSYSVSDNTLRVFYNGTSAGTKASPVLVNPTVAGGDFLTVATPYSGTAHFDGYLSDIRFTQGYARYTSNFTPPAISHRLK